MPLVFCLNPHHLYKSTVDRILPDPYDEIFRLYTLILNMPMKLGLKLMTSVSSDRMDTEWKFLNHIINKFNGILLIMTRVYFQCPDTSGIINSCILKASDPVALKIPQRDKFDINLDVVTWDFFRISSRVNSTAWRCFRQTPHSVSNKGVVNVGYRYLYAMITLQVPSYSFRLEFIYLSQVKNLINNFLG